MFSYTDDFWTVDILSSVLCYFLGAEHECRVVGEMLGARPLMGSQATRGTVEDQVQRAEVVHLATHVSWKLVAVVLAPVDFGGTTMHGKDQIIYKLFISKFLILIEGV